MRVLNYLEFASQLDRNGIGTTTDQQRAALATTDVKVVTSPWPESVAAGATGLLRGGGIVRNYDVAHYNLIGSGPLTVARQAKRNDVPFVLHSHVTREDFAGSSRGSTAVAPTLGKYLKWFYSQADVVLCPSEYTKRTLESYPVDTPIRPVSNGVDTGAFDGFEDRREEYRTEYDLDGMTVFTVGNVFERKGLTTFCTLAQETDYDFAWLDPYDTGPHTSKTVRYWVENAPENVTFAGWIDDIRGALGVGDVYPFATKNENQGIAVLEAMAYERTVAIRDIPVFEELYTHDHGCLKCSTDAELRRVPDLLARDPDLRRRLGKNTRKTAAKHSLDRVGDRLVETHEDALTGRLEG